MHLAITFVRCIERPYWILTKRGNSYYIFIIIPRQSSY